MAFSVLGRPSSERASGRNYAAEQRRLFRRTFRLSRPMNRLKSSPLLAGRSTETRDSVLPLTFVTDWLDQRSERLPAKDLNPW